VITKIKLLFLFLFIGFFLNAQNPEGSYNPYVNSGIISPSPLMPIELNGDGLISFRIGNTGGDSLYVYDNQYIILTITLSYVSPNIDSISGIGSEFFSWRYNPTTKTYSGKQISSFPPNFSEEITISFKIDQNSNTPGMNGFNVNIAPAPYHSISNSQNDDYISNYTFTEPWRNFNKSFLVGWNWFSINIVEDDMSLNNILLSPSDGDLIKNQTAFALYYDEYGWIGHLTKLDPIESYKIKVQNLYTLDYYGIAALDTLNIVTGWNWFGFLYQQPTLIEDVFSSFPLQELDYVKDQVSSATYYDEYGWFGSLDTLYPGDGYMGKFTNTNLKSAENNPLIPQNYMYNGSMIVDVLMESDEVSENDSLFAFVGDECRGMATPIFSPTTKSYVFPIMIYSNEEGEIITFKYYNYNYKGAELTCDETIIFKNNMMLGDIYNPISLSILDVSLDDNFLNTLLIYPNPFKNYIYIEYLNDSNIDLIIYDMHGRIILQENNLPNYYKLETYNLIPGTYIFKIIIDDDQFIKQFIHIK